MGTNIASVIPGIGENNLGKRVDDDITGFPTGVLGVTRRRDSPQSGASVDGHASELTTDINGKLWVNASVSGGTTSLAAASTGGYSASRVSGGLSTVVTTVQASLQSKLGGYILGNPNSTNAYVQIFNVATSGAVTLGTTVPKVSVFLPPFGGANIEMSVGIDFSAGIQVAATTTEAGLTALTTNITANFLFK